MPTLLQGIAMVLKVTDVRCSIKNALNRTYCWSISENTPKSWFPVQYNTLWHRLSLAIYECALHCVMDYITSQFILGWDFFKLYITVHYILQCITLQCNPDWVCSVHFGALQLIIAPNDVQCTRLHFIMMQCIALQCRLGSALSAAAVSVNQATPGTHCNVMQCYL